MGAEPAVIQRIMDMIPQQPPFRFVDSILEVDEDSIRGTCRFSGDEFFYQGHFPGNPVTPGVILIEAMAQAGVVGLGIYLMMQQGLTEKEIRERTQLFAVAEQVVFRSIVRPGDKLLVEGRKLYFRRNQIKAEVTRTHEDGSAVCSGRLIGRGVKNDAK